MTKVHLFQPLFGNWWYIMRRLCGSCCFPRENSHAGIGSRDACALCIDWVKECYTPIPWEYKSPWLDLKVQNRFQVGLRLFFRVNGWSPKTTIWDGTWTHALPIELLKSYLWKISSESLGLFSNVIRFYGQIIPCCTTLHLFTLALQSTTSTKWVFFLHSVCCA